MGAVEGTSQSVLSAKTASLQNRVKCFFVNRLNHLQGEAGERGVYSKLLVEIFSAYGHFLTNVRTSYQIAHSRRGVKFSIAFKRPSEGGLRLILWERLWLHLLQIVSGGGAISETARKQHLVRGLCKRFTLLG